VQQRLLHAARRFDVGGAVTKIIGETCRQP
jgi:hypothetical protein